MAGPDISDLHCLIDHQWPTLPALALAAKTKEETHCGGRKEACLPYPLELIPLTVIQVSNVTGNDTPNGC